MNVTYFITINYLLQILKTISYNIKLKMEGAQYDNNDIFRHNATA